MNPTRPVATRAGRSTSDDGCSAVTATRFDFGFTLSTAESGAWRLPHAGGDALVRGGHGHDRGGRAWGSGPGSRPHRPSATGEGR